MKIYVVHSTAFDYKKELYDPLRKFTEFEFVFPHANDNEIKDSKKLMSGCEVVLAEVSHPSTGGGIELGRAECLNIPIIAIHKKGSEISSAIKFVTNTVVEYDDLEKDFSKIMDSIKI